MSARYTGGLVYNAPGGWSGQFNGANYLSWSGSAVGTGAYTFECWFNASSFSASMTLIGPNATTTGGMGINVASSTTIATDRYGVAADNFTVPTLVVGVWYHVAVVRNSSGTTTVFLNGIRSSTGTVTDSYNYGAVKSIGYTSSAVNRYFSGYISNARFVNAAVYDPTATSITVPTGNLQNIASTAFLSCAYPTFVDGSSNAFAITNNSSVVVSTVNPFPTSQLPNPALGGAGNGVYTMSQYAALKAANLWPAYDPYYKNVTLMLHGDGTNAAQNNTFLDSSTNNFTITRNGNTTQGTFTPYGSNWSNYFDGSSNLALSSAPVSATGAFTVECWVYITGTAAFQSVYGQYSSSDAGRWMILWGDTAKKFTLDVGASTSYSSTNTYSANTWYHIAWVRDGSNNLSLYVNGVRDSTNAGVTTSLATVNPMIGNRGGGGTPYTGYISNLRITNTAVYSGTTYTVPTTPLTNISGTTLLTCQSNRFVDNETTAKTFTITGSPSVQRFSPFSPTTAYSTSVIGGSAYFDGSGDDLSIPTNSAFSLASSAFTIEAWVYFSSVSGDRAIISDYGSASTGWTLQSVSGIIKFYTAGNTVGITGTSTMVVGTWYHIAVSGTAGTSMKLFINGVQEGSTSTSNITDSSTAVTTGSGASTNYFSGYISNVRVVKGTALYTSTFTPSTTPLTAVSGTSLLLSYTNSAILDNAMMNDLETVGNAQISTSVKKYGTGSMYFDGTNSYLKSGQPSVAEDLNGGNFTIECWIYFTSVTGGDKAIISKYGNTAENAGGLGYVWQWLSAGNLQLVFGVGGGTDVVYQFAWTPTVNTWYHLAVTRSGSSARAFVNGNQVGSTATVTTSDVASPNPLQVGKTHTVAQYFPGYIDDLRITKGVARYTANFTPPTSQLQDQ